MRSHEPQPPKPNDYRCWNEFVNNPIPVTIQVTISAGLGRMIKVIRIMHTTKGYDEIHSLQGR